MDIPSFYFTNRELCLIIFNMFSNEKLIKMIVPLFFEQLLLMLVGLVDTFVITYAGESAVSGVSLVNMFNMIFIYLFTCLASGGAVVISQYIGNKDKVKANFTSSQLLMFSTLFSIVIMIIVLCVKDSILMMLFGKVEPSVMEAAKTYLRISAYSYPALAIYNAGAALYRSNAKTKVTMYISLASNTINVIGNCIGVFILQAGVLGVAYPSLIARMFSAVLITYLCFKKKDGVYYERQYVFTHNMDLLKRILRIAIPNGVEQAVFQLVKVALGSVIALFGTYQIAANGIAQSIWSVAALVGVTLSPVFTTVIGQCMGAQDIKQATYYFKKLLKWAICISTVWNIIVGLATPIIIQFYNISPQTKELVIILVIIHNIFNAFAYPISGPFSAGLRACGDVRYTMIMTVISTVIVRFTLSLLFAIYFNLGVIGIAIAMIIDWSFRATAFYIRFLQGKWKTMKVI